MRVQLSLIILAAVLLLAVSSCNNTADPSSLPEESPDANASPLTVMLRAVPRKAGTELLYNDLVALSDYENVTIPSREASLDEKMKWWRAIQDSILFGYSYPVSAEVWGFDSTEVKAILTVTGDPSLTILYGNLDTAALRQKLNTYGYKEEQYLGHSVFVWTPDATDEVLRLLPRAFGIIADVEAVADSAILVLMAGSGNSEAGVTTARDVVEAALAAYEEGTGLAYGTSGIASLAQSLGGAGSAFLTEDPRFEQTMQAIDSEEREKVRLAIGPGTIDNYSESAPEVAIAYSKKGESYIIDFYLALGAPMAELSVPVLERRLKEGRSYTLDEPLTELWSVLEVQSEGPHLHATVELTEQTARDSDFFGRMIYTRDYWFLSSD